MQEQLLQFFQQHPGLALSASLIISIVVAVIGILPSFFITAANILFFGFWKGLGISFLGEALGAVVAFWLYRKGFKKEISVRLINYPRLSRLIAAEGSQAFISILSLRLIPFVPSGLVTFAAAVGRVSTLTFVSASSIGKLPALLLEGYAVYQVTEFNWQGKLMLTLIAAAMLYFALRRLPAAGSKKQ